MPHAAALTICGVFVLAALLSGFGPTKVEPTAIVPDPSIDVGSGAVFRELPGEDDVLSGRNTPRALRPTPSHPTIAPASGEPAIAPISFPVIPGETGEVPLETIGRGYVSYYRFMEDFDGGCMAIRDQETWFAFWRVHTSGIEPELPAPDVDFSTDLVLGCILGLWHDCCESYISITDVEAVGEDYRVSIDAHRECGMADMVTNPFHLVKAPRTEGQVSFPLQEIPPVP